MIYNIASIVQYIVTTGDMSDPVTRCKLSDRDVQRIDEISTGSNCNLPLVSTVSAHRDYYEKMKSQKLTIASLETCIGKYVVPVSKYNQLADCYIHIYI